MIRITIGLVLAILASAPGPNDPFWIEVGLTIAGAIMIIWGANSHPKSLED